MKIKYLLSIVVSFLLVSNVFAHDKSATAPMTAVYDSETSCKVVNASKYKRKVKIVLKDAYGTIKEVRPKSWLQPGHAAYISWYNHNPHGEREWLYCRFTVFGTNADIHHFPATIQNLMTDFGNGVHWLNSLPAQVLYDD